ncbi:protein of unknown function [Acetoanaerobium sticklandii]|uniref:Uncharacterized protein n=1 Tax=Acetoanaerobium sticklandii (strain ATCC 12662 / DSM 519 / JCM 1433 / CCUG 9281 / NCIMB 10654 / HF) TaxID=499177 RepID=E3PY74_ACESD|nr:hypothetical protein [Acetoanaerobium sticklandii]CBH21389.1 protein of unknown function [Acetoanaerobium sticklandii]
MRTSIEIIGNDDLEKMLEERSREFDGDKDCRKTSLKKKVDFINENLQMKVSYKDRTGTIENFIDELSKDFNKAVEEEFKKRFKEKTFSYEVELSNPVFLKTYIDLLEKLLKNGYINSLYISTAAFRVVNRYYSKIIENKNLLKNFFILEKEKTHDQYFERMDIKKDFKYSIFSNYLDLEALTHNEIRFLQLYQDLDFPEIIYSKGFARELNVSENTIVSIKKRLKEKRRMINGK